MNSILLATIAMVLAQAARTEAGGESPADPNAQRLEFMKESVRSYEFTWAGGTGPTIKLQPDPAFRLGRQANGGVLEGAIFLWTDEVGRPQAAAQVFLHRYAARPQGEWLHEFTSLATGTLTASRQGTPRWSPQEAGITFEKVPGAAKSASSPSQRLRQMQTMAEDFHAGDNFGNTRWETLRMLPRPIARYGKPGETPEDGALFAFVEGTDPEVFLFIEARPGERGLEWQYACAPMSCWPLRVDRKGQPVWSLPLRATSDPRRPFYSLSYRP
jgi:hypothetical protein